MTREEKIEKQAAKEQFDLYESLDWRAGFISGAKWADENPNSNGKELLYVAQKTAERTKQEFISKACEWLDNINTYDYMDSGVFQMSDLIIDFKKQWNHEKKMYVL